MRRILSNLGRFVTTMDAKAATSLFVSIALLVVVAVMFLFGPEWLNLGEEGAVQALMERMRQSPAAFLAVAAIYTALALTGFPQILMITATVLTFGATTGALYAWGATMTSASITFALGRVLGGAWVSRFGGERVKGTIAFLARRGALASGLVRVVPSAPFIVVNAAAGAAQIPLWKFWLGTAIGIVPKIALVASLGSFAPSGDMLENGLSGATAFLRSLTLGDAALLLLIVGLWLGFLTVVRRFYVRARQRDAAGQPSSGKDPSDVAEN